MSAYDATNFRFIELFAGIGGFKLGLESIGGTHVFANEWDKFAAKTYTSWHGDHNLLVGDIRELDYSSDIPDHEVLTGGFPCQPFSLAGVSKKNSLGRMHGFDDAKQGNLFWAIAGIVEAKRPPVVFLENVKNLKSHDKGNTWKVIREALEDLGYEVQAKVIDARVVVPQHRERMFIVCFDKSKFTASQIASFAFPEIPDRGPVLEGILEEKPDEKLMLTDNLWSYLQGYAEKHRLAGNGFGFSLADREGVTRTLSARYYKDGSEILIQEQGFPNPRRLSPQEARQLMGYTDKYLPFLANPKGFEQVVSDVQSYKQFGNSVVPEIVALIGQEIRGMLRSLN